MIFNIIFSDDLAGILSIISAFGCELSKEDFDYIIKESERIRNEKKEEEEKKARAPEILSKGYECNYLHQPKKGIGFNIAGGLQMFNILKLGDLDEISPRYEDNKNDYERNFDSIAEENLLDLRPLVADGKYVYQNGVGVSNYGRKKLIPNWDNRLDRIFGNMTASGNFKQIIGGAVKEHIFNNDNPFAVNDILKEKGINYSYDRFPMYWIPTSPNRRTTNKVIRETDYCRYVYHFDQYTSDIEMNETYKKEERSHGVRFWYKDNTNYPSAIRPVCLSEFIEKYCTDATKIYENYRCSMYPKTYDEPVEAVKRMRRFLKNKIVVLEHRRINLSVPGNMSDCPILHWYMKQGWTLEDMGNDGINPMEYIFLDIKRRLAKGEGIQEKDFGSYSESSYKVRDKDSRSMVDNRSVLVTRTTIIDIEEVGLNDMPGIYLKDVDLVIGKMKLPNVNNMSLYPVDFINHPYSKGYVDNSIDRSHNIEMTYNTCDLAATKLYANVNGMIVELEPNHVSKNTTQTGVMIQRKSKGKVVGKKFIPVKDFEINGIFTSRRDAELFKQYTKELRDQASSLDGNKLFDLRNRCNMDLEELKWRNEALKLESTRLTHQNNLESMYMDKRLKQEDIKLKIQELNKKIKMLEIANEESLMNSGLETSKRIFSGIDTAIKGVNTTINLLSSVT